MNKYRLICNARILYFLDDLATINFFALENVTLDRFPPQNSFIFTFYSMLNWCLLSRLKLAKNNRLFVTFYVTD